MRVIVFALNGCPAGWLGAYGNDWVGTPNLDRLAAEGVVFDRHISDAPGRPTPPGPPSLNGRGEERQPNPPAPFLEGKGERDEGTPQTTTAREGSGSPLPFREGGPGGVGCLSIFVRANHPDTDAPDSFYAGWDEVFDARPQAADASPLDALLRALPALLDRLAAVTDFLLWIESDRLIPPWDVQQDVFEAYLEDDEDEYEAEDEDDEEQEDEQEQEVDEDEEYEEEEEQGEDVTAEVDSQLGTRNSERPEVVPPWADPPVGPFDRADLDAWDYLQRTFAALVTKLDAELGTMFDALRARGFDQSATWLVTSDHGFPLGEHGQVGVYRPWLHEELVHLPLLMRLPSAEYAGRRVPGFTQPPDLRATIRARFGAPPDGGFDLLPLARGEADGARTCAITALDVGGASERAIRTAEWALLLPTRAPDGDPPRAPRLYAKPDDRWEVNDVYAHNIDRADELAALLKLAAR
ncbi:MAG: hypothetical protein FJ304_13470 [Planctomycetes bacterium]|nr:hypothetical protein [Planctomycetota bacterium]